VRVDEHDHGTRRVICAIRHGGLNGVSFKFRPLASRREGDLTTIERALLLDVSIVCDPYYTMGGCWLVGDEPYLPPRLAALAEQFDRATPLAAAPCGRSATPRRLAVGLDPVRAQVMGYMARYMAHGPARFA
jgi:hypothetical protein